MLLYQLYGQFVQNASRCYLKKRKDVGGQVDGKFVERCGLNTVSELVKASLCSSLTFHPPSLKEHRLLVLRHPSPHLLSERSLMPSRIYCICLGLMVRSERPVETRRTGRIYACLRAKEAMRRPKAGKLRRKDQ